MIPTTLNDTLEVLNAGSSEFAEVEFGDIYEGVVGVVCTSCNALLDINADALCPVCGSTQVMLEYIVEDEFKERGTR